MLRNVSSVDLGTSILGQRVSMPICVGATAMQCMAHPHGETATAKGEPMTLGGGGEVEKNLQERYNNGYNFTG